MNRILIKVDIPEAFILGIQPNSDVRVAINSLGNSPLSARVSSILPKGDANARTFPVHIELPNHDFRIKSDLAAVAMFSVGQKRTATLLPKDAIVTSGDMRMVYAVENGKAVPVSVTVLGYYDNDAAIEGDLEPGQQVVTRGNERLRPGQAVEVVN